ncbi:capsule biosynthesis protein [Endozoicomonas montiporae]|uniref:Capsule polysaccharide export protein KpsS n=1 Tax=Endozoicomonas montiporae CL-33 TaxID=570277 RepID=A0A142BIY7_9GAMM|nr:capsular biosynthesis protein [Endozoicomonas montiporae]AMO58713.1 capsule polysaccharide export protein KpsS [Endozoicomonas montiporae CL-33]
MGRFSVHKSSVLFLQGPLGPFFRELAGAFSRAGYCTHKINFNGGDRFYAGADKVVDYQGEPDNWLAFLQEYLMEHSIDAVFLLGDCRYYHRIAKPLCDSLGVAFMVFEEGYLRPNTITLETHGVNALSRLDLSIKTLRETIVQPTEEAPVTIGSTIFARAVYASLYYWAGYFGHGQFAHYRHHRASNPVREGYCWIRGFARKWLVKPADYRIKRKLTKTFSQRFFLVPLQVHDDSQKIYHSNFNSVESFISEVIESFRSYAAPDQVLCFKHHPMDRGYTHYGDFIREKARRTGLQGRVLYCHDVSLPDLYDHAAGVVTVNSTVGVSAMLHSVPVKVMGRAMYDIEGLTHQGSLASFWQAPQPVDRQLFKQFHSRLFQKTQINGSFFKLPDLTCNNAVAFYEQLAGQPAAVSAIYKMTPHSCNNIEVDDLPLNAA